MSIHIWKVSQNKNVVYLRRPKRKDQHDFSFILRIDISPVYSNEPCGSRETSPDVIKNEDP